MVPRTFVIYFEYLGVGRRKDDRLLPELRGVSWLLHAIGAEVRLREVGATLRRLRYAEELHDVL